MQIKKICLIALALFGFLSSNKLAMANGEEAMQIIANEIASRLVESQDDSLLDEVLNMSAELQEFVRQGLVNAKHKLLLNVFNGKLEGHTDTVCSVDLSNDGKFAITGSYDGTARLWNLKDTPITFKEIQKTQHEIRFVRFTSDSKYAVTGTHSYLPGHGFMGTITLFNLTEFPITSQFLNNYNSLFDFKISDNGKYIISTLENTTFLCNLTSYPATCQALVHEGRGEIARTAISPDGKYAITGSSDNTVRLWNLSQNSISSIALEGYAGQLDKIEFSDDGKFVLTSSFENSARLWDLTKSPISSQLQEGHTEPIMSIALSSDGKYALTGSVDNTARLWDLSKSPITSQVLEGHNAWVSTVALSADGKYALTGGDDRTVRLWDLSKSPITSIVLGEHAGQIGAVSFSSDDKYILISLKSDNSGSLWLKDDPRAPLLEGISFYPEASIFSADGNFFLTGYGDGNVKLFNLNLLGISIAELILVIKLQEQLDKNLPYGSVLANPELLNALQSSKYRSEIMAYFKISDEQINQAIAQVELKTTKQPKAPTIEELRELRLKKFEQLSRQ